MADNNLQTSITKTLAYFDIFEFPLTAVEVWRYLYSQEKYSLEAVQAALNNLPGIKTYQGFCFLANRDERLVAQRHECYNIAEKKFKRAKAVAWWLAMLPGVRLILVCNNLSYSNARAESDIDLLIVAAAGRVWLTRFFCLTFLKVFGLATNLKNDQRQDRFCLSFFVAENNLDFSSLALPRDDIHFYYWLEQFYPLYDAGDYFSLLRQKNSWLKNYFANSLDLIPSHHRTVKLNWFWRAKKAAGEFIFCRDVWENFFHNWQLKILPASLQEKINRDVGVIIKPGVIKLIANDRREAYRNEWIIKIQNLLNEK